MSEHPGPADDAELAREIAAEAGRRLLALRSSYQSDGDGSRAAAGPTASLRDAGDLLSHEYITAELAHRRPDDALLSEEGPARPGQPARQDADRVWIVDPLDGTREFGEPGRTDWAVHVALWEREHTGRGVTTRGPGAEDSSARGGPGGELTAGAVALPAQGMTLSTLGRAPSAGNRVDAGAAEAASAVSRKAQRAGASTAASGEGLSRGVSGGARGAERGTVPGDAAVPDPVRKPFRIVVSRTRRPAIADSLAELLGAELVPLGSAGAKVAAVLAGEADAYVHEGGFYEWDTAAPVAVARSAGFHASRLDGGPLRFNQENVWMPDILVCPSALAGTLLDAIKAARSGSAPAVPGDASAIG